MITPFSFLPNHTEHLRQLAASKPGRRGPKQNDQAELIGQRRGRLTCVDVLPTDKNRRTHIICVCDCGRASSPRVERFLSGESASCKCLKAERFKAFQARRAENLSPAVCRAVFITSAMTGTWKGSDLVVAKLHNLPSHRIRAIVALHQQRLLEKYGAAVSGSRLISRRALDKSLHVAEFNWIAKHAPRVDDGGIEIDWNELTVEEQEFFNRFGSMMATE